MRKKTQEHTKIYTYANTHTHTQKIEFGDFFLKRFRGSRFFLEEDLDSGSEIGALFFLSLLVVEVVVVVGLGEPFRSLHPIFPSSVQLTGWSRVMMTTNWEC